MIAAARERQRRRRILALGALALLAAVGMTLLVSRAATPPRAAAREPLVMAQTPYVGVVCHALNATQCRRVGIAVWFRHPVKQLVATLAGERVRLHRDGLGGKVLTYWGYVHLDPATLHLPVRYTDSPGRYVVVKLKAHLASGDATRTIRLLLHPGWG